MITAAKHTRTFTHQFLTGITADDWWRLLKDNGLAVDACYWHRAAFLTVMSLINSSYRKQEERNFAAAVAATAVTEPPVFILGHWRSGTTHLHNILVQNREQFAYPTVYQASFPHTFLSTEHVIPRRVARFIPETRMFDNVAFHLDEPQEDEFAMCIASGFSPFMGMVFPQRSEHYDRYLTLRDVPQAEIDRWKATLLWFFKKLTYRHNRPIIMKSPPHTARVRLLLDMFPAAKFVHIARNPYTVFKSTRHMYDTMVWHTYLQKPNLAAISEGILRRYEMMYDSYFEERTLIPPGQLHELRFEDLRSDPLGQIEQLYTALAMPGFASFEPHLRAYIASLDGYRQNDYSRSNDDERALVAQRWARNFAQWGYAV